MEAAKNNVINFTDYRVKKIGNVFDMNGNQMPLGVVDGDRVVKLKKDGTPKRTVNNMPEGGRTVDPLKDTDIITDIAKYLNEKSLASYRKIDRWANMRNEMMFVIGIYIGVRVSDLILLKWKDIFKNCETREFNYQIRIKEGKTQKCRDIDINDDLKEAVMNYLNDCEEQGLFEYLGITTNANDYVFPSKKDKKGHVTDAVVEKLMKSISDNVKAGRIRIATRTIRKTFAYNIYVLTGDLALVQEILNHSSVRETRRYLGLDDDMMRDAYLNLKLINHGRKE